VGQALTIRTPSYRGFKPASAAASKAMQANRSEGGRAESLLRGMLWRRGIRYRKHVRTLPGCPDLVLSSARLCVFCDGDFWHGRSWPELQSKLQGRANPEYWIPKIARNIERDRETDRKLRDLGWAVLRVWESDILRAPDQVTATIAKTFLERRYTLRMSARVVCR
jgi:DNA mismatch endonuclease, patch repair protein